MEPSLSLSLKMASPSSHSLPLSRPRCPLPEARCRKGSLAANGHRRSNCHGPISLKSLPSSRFSSNGYHSICCFKAPTGDPSEEKRAEPALMVATTPEPQVQIGMWNWQGYRVRYQFAGKAGPALVLIHGFGANSDHWRKNISALAKSNRVYSIDLIGYGYSEKPNPREFKANSFYTFETWATQLNEFCTDVVKDEAFFICNSIGVFKRQVGCYICLTFNLCGVLVIKRYCIYPHLIVMGVVGLQAALLKPDICRGIVLLNISLRMLHIKKQPWYGKPFIKSFQGLLRNTPVGKLFYKLIATPDSVRSILCQCYHDKSAVTEELVELILQPGLEPGAVDVFLEFICYSGGPLPEELLPQMKCPVLVAWGDKDPWEPVELGKVYAEFDSVEDFVILPNVGHCPQDEAPDLVNPLIESFIERHTMKMAP